MQRRLANRPDRQEGKHALKITRVESFLMSYPMPEPVKLCFWAGERTILKRDAMLIRVTTDTGLRGYAPGPAHERADREIRQTIAPFLIVKDPRCRQSPKGCLTAEFRFQADPVWELILTKMSLKNILLFPVPGPYSSWILRLRQFLLQVITAAGG